MNPFKFNLKFGTEDDNNQSAGSRLNFGYTEYSEYLTASVGLSTKINTYTNFNCRLLYKDPVSSGLTTATNNGTQSSSSSSIITLYYKSDYIQKFGYYNLYGWCTKGDCQAEGYWTP
ncbi:hypothetical protein [Anaerosporobacter sp.]|uniref:hypothetical protein n=1 Tax=Anaerosporobacter sp. TaxID=1872529 RepID=UPI00286F511F|nr:hypothetical protein [Anaerosporobacter sp.]